MKEAVILMISTAAVLAQPLVQRSRSGPFWNSRIEEEQPVPGSADSYGPPDDNSPPTDEPSGPYPPKGWAPSGDLLLLPGETHSSQQQNNYGAPPPPPSNQYGSAITTTPPTTTTTIQPIQEPEASDANSQQERPDQENGKYYVLLPNGKLQKVQYSGKQSSRGQYEAQVQYEEVEPVSSPIYTYPNLPLQFTSF